MDYNMIRIHTPALTNHTNVVEIHTASSIPEFLRDSIIVDGQRLWLDNAEELKSAPLDSVIAYKKTRRTVSGYNCWSIGQLGVDLIKFDGTYYTKPPIVYAMRIPAENDLQPIWVRFSHLTYNGDGTVTLKNEKGNVSGRVGVDFLLCHGMNKKGEPIVDILTTADKNYSEYIICDDAGNDIAKLCEVYPM